MSDLDSPLRIVLTGASRGLGLAFTSHLLALGHRVFALAREPRASQGLIELGAAFGDRLEVSPCDVTDPSQVAAAAAHVERSMGHIDLLIHNAGVAPERRVPLAAIDLEQVRHAFEVNAIAPLSLTRAFLPLLLGSPRPRIVCISTQMASLAQNREGLWYGYRMSKPALNMAVVNLSLELASSGVVVCALHPGWVRTDMGGPEAPLEPAAAVTALVKTIANLGPQASGCFLDYQGRNLPW